MSSPPGARQRQRAVNEPAIDQSGLSAEYFDVMASFSQVHWWYRNRAAWVTEQLAGTGGTGLDVGCGTGGSIAALEAAGCSIAVGSDLSRYALNSAQRLGRRRLFCSVAEALPVATDAVRCLTSMDVLEHLDDDLAAVKEYVRCIQPGGRILLMCPAYPWLFSDHDRWAEHRRRYTVGSLRQLGLAAGLEVERSTYLYSFLVPAAFLLRRTALRHLKRSPSDESTSFVHPALNRVLYALSSLERRWGRRHRIPFGLTAMVIGRVPS
jgi:ubiquinone/menaquinone biosynthesis C-methylase UbiE